MKKGTRVSAGNKRRVQVRKERKDAFNAAKKQIFLDHLAGCCTVAHAAAAAGVSVNTVNYHRRNDPVFAQQFEEALALGYGNVEAMALEYAARGGHYVPGPDADKAPGPERMDIAVAMHLLDMRRKPLGQRTGKAGYAPRTVSAKALNDSLLAKLEVLHRRRTLRRRSGQALKREAVRKLKTPALAKAALAAAEKQGKPEPAHAVTPDRGPGQAGSG